MNVLVVGGHGKVGRRLLRLLAARGDTARGMIRKPEEAADLEAIGAEPVVCDIEAEEDISGYVSGCDAVVFAAGAGPGSGPERKRTVDLGGALKLMAACHATGVSRYLMISAMGVDRPGFYGPEMQAYVEAKREADEALIASGLDYTIVRPGMLGDDPGTNLIEVGTGLDRGEVTRDDVAATLVAVLDEPRTAGLAFELLNGETEIAEAIAELVAQAGR
jgi:uncharacterized protein YbjT (DUF2867 family)